MILAKPQGVRVDMVQQVNNYIMNVFKFIFGYDDGRKKERLMVFDHVCAASFAELEGSRPGCVSVEKEEVTPEMAREILEKDDTITDIGRMLLEQIANKK